MRYALLAVAVLALLLTGCGSVAPNCTATDIYTPSIFRQIGIVTRIEDPAHGTVLYYITDSDRTVLLHAWHGEPFKTAGK